MKKLLVAALVAFMGAAQAQGDGFDDLFDYYVEYSLGGNDDVYHMALSAWECDQGALYRRIGANYKSEGLSYEDAIIKEGVSDDYKALVEPLIMEGFGYDGPLDRRINKKFTQCLIEAHKKITSK